MYLTIFLNTLKRDWLLLRLALVAVCLMRWGYAEAGQASFESQVHFVETEDANCVVNDSKLISLQSLNASDTLEVWVDRWFINVQTADHTKHILSADQLMAPLGCANTVQGRQFWTIDSVKKINQP